jgi:hypothetical protein
MKRLNVALGIIVAFTFLAGITTTSPTFAVQAFSIVTCAATTACTGGTNTSSGPGVQGVSSRGKGVVGQTKFNSTSASNGQAGVLGADLSTSGAFDSGVSGTSIRGAGVAGKSSSNAGVQGVTSTFAGVLGKATSGIGVLGVGHFAVEGSDNNTGGDNILANGTGGNLFRGNNSAGLDVFTIADNGVETTATVNTPYLELDRGNTGGIYILGTSTTGNFSIGANGDASFDGQVSADSAYFTGTVSAASYTTHAAIVTRQRTSAGSEVQTYASQSTAPMLEDVGEAELVSGQAYVRIDARFAGTIARATPYYVFITPEGPTRGTLYTTQKTVYGFAVRESYPGHSTVAFDYRIVAKPYGTQMQRLESVPEKLPTPHPKFAPILFRKTNDIKPGRPIPRP